MRGVGPGTGLVLLVGALSLLACGGPDPVPGGAGAAGGAASLVVDYPLDGSIFPPEFLPPTFLWHDPDPRADSWLVECEFAGAPGEPMRLTVPGLPPPKGEIDEQTISATSQPYAGTDYQNSARSWTPTAAEWARIKERSVSAPATIRFTGFASGEPATPLSRGSVRISTSVDPVGAPIFYRDVPLMPEIGEAGRIKPLADALMPLIAWRLRDVSRRDSKLVLKGMSSCGNCHSFSLDGKTLGMDVDGPAGDKGMYTVKDVSKHMEIGYDDVLTWNSFPGRPEGHKTIGFLSRISPDGKFVVSTVNESLYVENYENVWFVQVFYPTRGIFAYWSRDDGQIRALPGADDPAFVHCDPAWTPDGKSIVFARAPAKEPYEVGQEPAKYPNDPNEREMRYDLYRMPFDGGKGGTPVPVEGASANGVSNTFPKVSPDGRWIVFVKCRNGLLMRPDGRLWIVPVEGGTAREMRCNTKLMNSWHSFSPNSRWMVFSSKVNRPYTQAFLTHIDEDGNDSPPILVPNCTADNRAVNLPEFLNAPYDALDSIDVPAIRHHTFFLAGEQLIKQQKWAEAIPVFRQAIEAEPTFSRAHLAMGFCLANLGRTEEARDHFALAARCDPSSPVAWFNLALARLGSGQPADAARAMGRLHEILPWDPRAEPFLVRADREVALLRKRAEGLRKELAANPDDADRHRRLADLLSAAGEEKEAAAHLARAVELRPDDAPLAVRLAWLLATSRDGTLRNGEQAIAAARRAVELTGGEAAGPLDALAAALAEAGRFPEAAETAEKAAARADPADLLLTLGVKRRLTLYRHGLKYEPGPD